MYSPNKRMAVNTAILYFKLIFTILVNLYATRLILNALGVEDYGIVNLISGIVAMLSFVKNSMTVSTQRYLSVNIGRNNPSRQFNIFNTSVFLHLLLGVVIVLLLEAASPLVFHSSIQIPSHRLPSSVLLYQLTILGTFITIISVPYDATLNAHENMLVYSLASILESIIRLLGAILLLKYHRDKLIFYGILVVTIRLASFFVKFLYSRYRYDDARIRKGYFSSSLMKEMFSFATWNMFGSFALTARNQGMAFVLNIFNGIAINSAYGIASQVLGQLSNFVATIQKSMNPQIMQREGSGNTTGMLSLALKQSKYSSFLLLFFILPLMTEMPYVLRLWLKTVPDYTVGFCRIILMLSFFQQLTSGLQSAIQAKGIIRNYQITISIVLLINIPLAYCLLKIGYSAYFVLFGMVVVELLCLSVRVAFAHHLVGLKIKDFIYKLIIPVFSTYFLSFLTMWLFHKIPFFANISHFSVLLLYVFISSFVIALMIAIFLSRKEKQMIIDGIRKILFR